jgi:hypothetical protein
LLLRHLWQTDREQLYTALEMIAEREMPEAKADLTRIFSQNGLSTRIRVKAAIALARLGDRRGQDLVKKVAFGNVPESEDALRDLPVVIGDEAAPMLYDFIQRTGVPTQAVRSALYVVKSDVAVPLLIELLRKAPNLERVKFALVCLADRGRDAIPAVAEVIKHLQVDSTNDVSAQVPRLAAQALGPHSAGREVCARRMEGGEFQFARLAHRPPRRTGLFHGRFRQRYLQDSPRANGHTRRNAAVTHSYSINSEKGTKWNEERRIAQPRDARERDCAVSIVFPSWIGSFVGDMIPKWLAGRHLSRERASGVLSPLPHQSESFREGVCAAGAYITSPGAK